MTARNLAQLIFTFGLLAAVAVGQSAKKPPADLLNFLRKMDEAQVQLQKGDAASYKRLWSDEGDVTISGGFGGTIEKGWDAVSKRLDWAATQFANGTNSIERIVVVAEGNIGYLIQVEHIKFNVRSTGMAAGRDYRVTMIFRRERGRWKIVHRHADSQTSKLQA